MHTMQHKVLGSSQGGNVRKCLPQPPQKANAEMLIVFLNNKLVRSTTIRKRTCPSCGDGGAFASAVNKDFFTQVAACSSVGVVVVVRKGCYILLVRFSHYSALMGCARVVLSNGPRYGLME